MMPKLRLGLFGALLAIGLTQPNRGSAYELRTHGEITRAAHEKSEGIAAYLSATGVSDTDRFDLAARTERRRLGLFENTGTALDWMIEGSIREDDYIDRVLGTLLGCPRPRNPPSQSDRIVNHFFDLQRGGRGLAVPGVQGVPAPEWALGRQGRGSGPGQNEFSLLDARDYQYQSLVAPSRDTRDKYTALLFRTLGHVLHIVQDMAQPQHTRNDSHVGCTDLVNLFFGDHSWYEHYVEDRTLRRVFPRGGEIPPALVLGGYDPVSIRPYQEFFTDVSRRGIADFSSRNFLSAGTNLGGGFDPCGGLTEPPCEATAYRQISRPYSTQTLKGTVSAPVTLYTRDVVDALTGQAIRDVPISSRSLWDEHLGAVGRSPKFSLNRFNYDAMADLLLPRAVGYAAGFLNAFFRGSVGATYEGESLRIGGSSETMIGDFKLLYERSDGTRGELGSWTGLRIDPDGLSQPLSTPQLPEDAVPDAPCFLIFRGQLGLEQGAVVGSQGPCPPTPPTPPTHGPWTVYSCVYRPYGAPDIRYRYATTDPPLAEDGLPIPQFFLRPPLAETVCSISTLAVATQPPNTVTEHLM